MSRRSDTENPFEEDEPRTRRRRKKTESGDADQPARRRRWPWVLLLLGLLVLFLPNLIGWVGLQQRALDVALADFNGTVSIEKVSLGWFQPVKLTNVTAVDAEGNSLLQIAGVTSSKSLYSFLTSKDYGQFDVQIPVLYLQLRPDGSNLEDAIAKYIAPVDPNDPKSTEPTPLPKLNINVTDGQAIVSSSTSAQTWQIDQLNAVAQTSGEAAPLIIDAECRVTPAMQNETGQPVLQNPGGLAFTTQIDAGQTQLSFSSADVLLETENLTLSLAAPVFQRFIGPANMAGNLNGKIQAAYDAQTQSVALAVEQMNLSGFGIVAPELLGSDQFVLDNISAKGGLQISPAVITAQQFNLQTDVGQVNADGSFDIHQLANMASSGTLLDTPFQMDGKVDLARLVRMLPSTLQLHNDLVVNSGSVTFEAGSHNENGTRRLVFNLDTANLNARRGGQNIVWAKPLRLVGTVQESQGQLALENVRCESDFLTIIGSGNAQTGSFVAQGDLSELMKRVGQFVDLGSTKLGGVLDGKFGWQVNAENPAANPIAGIQNLPIQIGGSFVVTSPVIEMEGMPRWQQEQMSVKLSGAGKSTGKELQLDQGGFQVDIGTEKFVAILAQPVADAYTQEIWNANCQVTGSMAEWLGHIQNFVDLGEISTGGQITLTCGAAVNSKAIQFSNVEYEIQQLAFDGYGMKIRDPKVAGAGIAVYDFASGNTTIPETTLSANSISARGQQIVISFPGNMRVDGNIAFKADVNRVADWYELSPTPESVFWFGTMDGTVQLVSNENGIGGRLNSTITDLIAATQTQAPAQPGSQGQTIQVAQPQRQWQEIWRETKLGLVGDFSLANDFNSIGFQNVQVDSPSLKVKASGSVADLAESMTTDITGSWIPNWEKINSLVQAYTGNMFRFAGTGEQQFVFRGPLYETMTPIGQSTPWVSPALQAAAGFGWERGEILGLPVGASQMELNLQQGVAYVKSNGIPFAGGVVQFAPQIDMRSQQPVLTMGSTRLIDNVSLQPETARQWLKYVAPLVADATSAQGNFTVDISGLNVPLMDPMKMDAQGEVRLSNVVIGAGPTTQQLLGTIKQLRAMLKPESTDRDLNTWLQMSEQTVPVVVKNGRVFHDKLRFTHKDLSVQTSGSVGFDQTLDLVAQIPIADDWIAGKPYLASLRGQSISIPVSGTASKPKLDKRGIEQLSANLVKQAASGAINQAIGEKLTPKINDFQNQVNDKIGGELNKLQGKFGEKLGGALFPGSAQPVPAQPGGTQPGGIQPNPTQQPGQPPANNQSLENQLLQGIGNLFGK